MANPSWYLDRAESARIQRQITHRPAPDDAPVTGPCWVWGGEQTPNGYGKYRLKGRTDRVIHRIMWEAYNAQAVPAGRQLDHLCRVRLCCNPVHLEVVTPSVNTDRQDHANRRKTHCPKGHEYTPENTLTDGVRRWCRTCRAERRAAT